MKNFLNKKQNLVFGEIDFMDAIATEGEVTEVGDLIGAQTQMRKGVHLADDERRLQSSLVDF